MYNINESHWKSESDLFEIKAKAHIVREKFGLSKVVQQVEARTAVYLNEYTVADINKVLAYTSPNIRCRCPMCRFKKMHVFKAGL